MGRVPLCVARRVGHGCDLARGGASLGEAVGLIYPAVLEAFWAFTVPLEGYVPHMYRDTKDYVTVGVGNLVDPMPYAMVLPFKRRDGSPATREEIANEWRRIHIAPDLGKLGWRAAEKIATLHLDEADVEALFFRKVEENAAHLAKRCPIASVPADAQMALLSWSWAVGPAGKYPKMLAAVNRGDYAAAAEEIRVTDGKGKAPGTLAIRNAANRRMMLNASAVAAAGMPYDVLHHPTIVLPPEAA